MLENVFEVRQLRCSEPYVRAQCNLSPMDRQPFSSRTVHLGRMPPKDVPFPCKYFMSSAVSWLSSMAWLA